MENFFENNSEKFIQSAIIILGGLLLIKIMTVLLNKTFKKTSLNPAIHVFLRSLIQAFLLVLLGVILLDTMGVQMSSIIAMLGVIGLAISLAVQGVLSDITAGFVLIASKPFKIGDYIQVDSIEGSIQHINIIHTRLSTVDNKMIYIPNSQVAQSKIINFSHEITRRLDVEIPISYHDDFEQVKKLLTDIVSYQSLALQDPPPVIRVWEFSDHAIIMVIRVWVQTENFFDLKFNLLENIKQEFDRENLKIPFNQLEVTLRKNTDN